MDAPERNYLKTIMIIATLGGLLFGYDTGVVNGSLPFMAAPDQLDLTPLNDAHDRVLRHDYLFTADSRLFIDF